MHLKTLVIALCALTTTIPNISKANEPYCREYTKEVRVGGELQPSYGTACLQPDGDWKIVSEGNTPPTKTSIIIHDEPTYYTPSMRTRGYNSYSSRYPSSVFSISFGNNRHKYRHSDRYRYKDRYYDRYDYSHRRHRNKKHYRY